jgi:hypothetical protein
MIELQLPEHSQTQLRCWTELKLRQLNTFYSKNPQHQAVSTKGSDLKVQTSTCSKDVVTVCSVIDGGGVGWGWVGGEQSDTLLEIVETPQPGKAFNRAIVNERVSYESVNTFPSLHYTA